jgi:hypothetical protein
MIYCVKGGKKKRKVKLSVRQAQRQQVFLPYEKLNWTEGGKDELRRSK